jgi:hypothetical protein
MEAPLLSSSIYSTVVSSNSKCPVFMPRRLVSSLLKIKMEEKCNPLRLLYRPFSTMTTEKTPRGNAD